MVYCTQQIQGGIAINIAYFLLPKSEVAYLSDDCTFRQAIERMRRRSYTAIPVIDKDGKYVGTISEGDLLYSIIPEGDSERIETVPLKSLENFPISRIIQKDSYPAVRITVSMEEMLERALKQNFIPVVDDEDTFIGIVTRNSIIQYYASGKK